MVVVRPADVDLAASSIRGSGNGTSATMMKRRNRSVFRRLLPPRRLHQHHLRQLQNPRHQSAARADRGTAEVGLREHLRQISTVGVCMVMGADALHNLQ